MIQEIEEMMYYDIKVEMTNTNLMSTIKLYSSVSPSLG